MNKIKYSVTLGNNVVVLIKTGFNGTVYGYENKYSNLAKKINEQYGYSVVVADNPYDGTDPIEDAIKEIEVRISKDFIIYYMGVSLGGSIGAWYGKYYPQIKRMLLINAPLDINIDKTISGLEELKCEKITLVYGSLDPSYNYAKELKFNKPINIVIKDKMDHNFSQSMDEFMNLPFEYLLK